MPHCTFNVLGRLTAVCACAYKQVETAGDCYIAAGGLTMLDADGFLCIDPSPDPVEAAKRVLSFAKARGSGNAYGTLGQVLCHSRSLCHGWTDLSPRLVWQKAASGKKSKRMLFARRAK